MTKKPHKKLLANTYCLSELPTLARSVVSHLQPCLPFTLLLTGYVGCGKTTFSRFLLNEIGVTDGSSVTSPSFCYAHTYDTTFGTIVHMDLYRCDGKTLPLEMGLDHLNPVAYLVEWPEKLPPELTDHLMAQDMSCFWLKIENHDTTITSDQRFFQLFSDQ
ncbi:MAG: tRNA (adenosine(37)-N6)-threonylcarbamoyltransferase complex ATPase subunit type 1 TsaE [Proteobacteria bacterium]|nr:tRNA (adenosine(37)-N6)-threonylcarbamoyltransferase complex ATPase subunit type 1 TsaE [Pseudomonadota bacterium]